MNHAKVIYLLNKKQQFNRWTKEQNKSVADLKKTKECIV